MKICKIVDCNVRVRSRGWCNRHYQNWYRNNDPLSGGRRFNTPEESFAARTEWQGDCLVWTGTVNEDGYGRFWVGGRNVYAHRYAWEREHGTIPEGMLVDHKDHCDTRCCNTEHLRLATHSQNNMNKKGSSASSGYRNVYLTEEGNYKVIVAGNYFGRYTTLVEADNVAAEKRRLLFGEFAGRS